MSALLSIDIARKAFAGRPVLAGVRFEVAAGEIVALVGASGSGKSTLLRIAAGLEHDFVGTVRFQDESVRGPRSGIGIMFQEPRLLPWLSIADNVAFSADGAQGSGERAVALLQEVGVDGYADALPKQLSGGMAQRVALARALFSQPALLLLDEPFSAVDALTRMRLQDLLLRIAIRHSITVVLVTHDVDEALYLADRVMILQPHPGTLRGEVASLRRPRDRADASLAQLKNTIVAQL